ncbi:MAG: hypothetical protein AAGA48_09180 [Myxococcota bacterium]
MLHGRDALLNALREMIRPGCRVTLMGPGGVGKTRLAQAIAAEEGRFVALAEVRTVDETRRALAYELDLDGDRLDEALRAAAPTRLILDNCEQLEPEALVWLEEVLPETWPIVVTSRRSLDWGREFCFEVPPLSGDAALQVFLDAAPRPFADMGHPEALLRILDRLEGLPLALRLAAGRLDVVDLATLERFLDEDYLTVLADPDNGGRHGSIDRTVAWSWDPLDPRHQRALLACVALGGPFDLEAAHALLERPLDDLHALTRRHLVEVGEGRYRVPEPVRQFALGRLVSSPGADSIYARVDDWWATCVAGWLQRLHGPHHAATLAAATRSFGGLTRLVGHGTPDRARNAFAVLAEVVEVRGPATEGLRWASCLISRTPSADARAEALAWRSRWHRRLGAVEEATADADAAIETASEGDAGARSRMERAALRLQRGLSDAGLRRAELEGALAMAQSPALRATLLAHRALALHDTLSIGEAGLVDATLAQALAIATELGCPAVQLQVHAQAGTIHLERAVDPVPTQRHLTRALELATTLGRRRKQGFLFGQLALAIEASDPDVALSKYDKAIQRLREAGDPVSAATWMGMRSRTELLTGDPARARRDLRQSLGWLERAGDARIGWYLRLLLAAESMARGNPAPFVDFVDRAPPVRDKEGFCCDVVAALDEGLSAAEAHDEGGRQTALAKVAEFAAMSHLHEVHTLAGWVMQRLEEAPRWWRIEVRGRWHMPPGASRQPVKGAANQRVLAYLATLRQDEPGAEADTEALAAAGWPGERLVAKAAGNRVRVALSTLRRAGLTAWIERGDQGWYLAMTHPIRRIQE